MTRERRPGLRLRLLFAFAVVAAAAIGAFAALTLDAARSDVAALVRQQQQATLRDTVGALADAFREAGTWEAADLLAARAVAFSGGALLEVRDTSGALVLQPGSELGPAPPAGLWADAHLRGTFGSPRTARILVAGELVGRARLRFPKNVLPPAEQRLSAALTRSVLLGSGVAAAVVLAIGLVVTAVITRPLRRLTAAAQRLRRGDRGVRANVAAPGELGELATAFDEMAAALEREDQLRRTMTADIAHELRTPVTILIAHFEAMLDGVAEPSTEHIGALHDEAKRLARLIEDLGALASAEAAGLALERRPVDLAQVVRRECDLSALRFAEAEVALTTTLAEDAVVRGDAQRLAQVARNLLGNALTYTPAGGRVDVRVAADDAYVELAVSDTGIGIDADELPHIFERFWRGRGARGRSGSGIGLAVVDELVRSHGGSVGVESSSGRGTTFTVALPLVRTVPDRRDLHRSSTSSAPGLHLRGDTSRHGTGTGHAKEPHDEAHAGGSRGLHDRVRRYRSRRRSCGAPDPRPRRWRPGDDPGPRV